MYLKRVLDILIAGIALLFFMPLLIFVSLVICFTDGFPVLFKQSRVGRDRRLFEILKFRTMTLNASAQMGSFDAGDGSRVTKVGKVLRKYKIDEFPQLLNVLKGDMSLIGPRPEIPSWTQVYADDWEIVLKARPGITDQASILFRHEEEILANSKDPNHTYENEVLPAKLELYKQYVSDIRFSSDVSILLRTLGSLANRGI